MMSAVMFYVGLVAFVLTLIYFYHDEESGKHSKLKKQLQETAQRNLEMYKSNKDMSEKIQGMESQIREFSAKVNQSLQTVDHLQEHCAKLRESQIQLDEKLSKKRPLIKIPGAIAVELYSPSKNLGNKKKK